MNWGVVNITDSFDKDDFLVAARIWRGAWCVSFLGGGKAKEKTQELFDMPHAHRARVLRTAAHIAFTDLPRYDSVKVYFYGARMVNGTFSFERAVWTYL